MDPSLVVLLCVFVISVVVHGAIVAWLSGRSLRTAQQTETMLSSAVDAARALEQTVAQRSSMADEVSALRQPLTESVVAARQLSVDLQKAIAEMAGNLISVPKMIEAIAEIGKRQVEILEAVNKTAETLYDSLHMKTPQASMRSYDPAMADREYAINQLQRMHGMSREEAAEQIRNKGLWDALSVTP